MAQLGELRKVRDQFDALGVRLVGLSPDRPAKVAETVKKSDPGFPLVSDAPADVLQALGLAFVQQDARYARLLEDASGLDHHILPAPAVVLVDADKSVRLMHADPRYQRRLAPSIVLEAARDVAGKSEE